MIAWKDKNIIIFSLYDVLIKNNLESIYFCEYVEKFLFYLLQLKTKPKLYLVSDLDKRLLENKLQKSGLNIFFDNVTSSAEFGLVRNDSEFWVEYINRNHIDTEKAVLFESKLDISMSAAASGLETYLIVNNTNEQSLEQNRVTIFKHKLHFINNFKDVFLEKIEETTEEVYV